ncbi:MAG TPA: hypothetical protein VL262_10800 [Vicinamibacterales bacterium]|jgi:hypothetical protein|nr:hypothetical protein [Vicinamibacterales bacterium]
MQTNRAALTVVVILVVLVGGWWLFHRGSSQTIDLMTFYDQAQKDGEPWSAGNVTLAGETLPAISAPPNGRLHMKVRVPDDGWLKVSLGLKPEAWDKEGDGVYFFVGVSDGRAFEVLFTQTVDPYRNKSEQRWIRVSADLSSYAGEEVELVFNTRASAPERGAADARNDLPVWGAPTISTR